MKHSKTRLLLRKYRAALTLTLVVLAAVVTAGLISLETRIPKYEGSTIQVSLPSKIEPSKEVDALLAKINKTRKGDVLFVYTDSMGGSVATAAKIVLAIYIAQDRGVKVHTIVRLGAYSAAAIITCTGDQISMAPGALLFYHSVQLNGKPMVASDMTEVEYRAFNAFMQVCHNVLTQEEIHRLLTKPTEIFILNSDLKERIKENE